MPTFVEVSTGLAVDEATATFGGKIRPGFTEILGPGDYVSFDVSLCDSRSPRRWASPLTVNDSRHASVNATNAAAVARIRDARFDGSMPTMRATDDTDDGTADGSTGRAPAAGRGSDLRDALRAARYR